MSETNRTAHQTKIKILIIGFWPDYERQCFEAFSDKNIRIIIVDPREVFQNNKYKILLPRKIKNEIYKHHINKIIKEHTGAIYVFQDSKIFIEFMLCKAPERSHLIFRNTISDENSSNVEKLKSKGHIIWSFDKNDCKRYNINYYNQFIHRIPGISDTPIRYDFAFVGRDKNREIIIRDIKKRLEGYGFNVNIKIIKDNSSTMPYVEYLKESCKARCLIDVTKDGQSGMTLRPLEAAVYNRKLLTNNKGILDSNLYSENRVLLTDSLDSINSVKNFIKKPMNKIHKNLINLYSIDKLIMQVLSCYTNQHYDG